MAVRCLLVANRGEIAVRIVRAARELGVRTAVACSSADKDSLAVRLADRSVEIGPPQASKSYLNIPAVLAAAKQAEADAVHPGYGFLAENADFADAVEAEGMVFVGPTGDTIRLLGDKAAARTAATAAGVPVLEGSEGRAETHDQARTVAGKIGYPVMIKAAAGGGGRGIRIANNNAEFDLLAPQAGTEAGAAFGDAGIYVEKFVRGARHVEVQVLGDGRDVVHCFERECSLQRRRQKVWEEAPAVSLHEKVRAELCLRSVDFARSVDYRGAGTLEYLYDGSTQEFYFLEMNTRIQVEHPVTECVTGVDLVREMLRIAGGEPLRLRQQDITLNGHALECRINAEDPGNDFLPDPGLVRTVTVPGGPGVRFDTMLYPGCEIPPFYDSLLGKLIVWDRTRAEALHRMGGALAEFELSGVNTTKSLHQTLVADRDVIANNVHTGFLEQWLERRAAS